MPLYFFDIHDGVAVEDDVGTELADAEAARLEAFRLAARYAAEPSNLEATGTLVVTVRDGPESVALTVRLVCSIEMA